METDLLARGQTVEEVPADEREAAWERAKAQLKNASD
jgi:hypothetical protein